MKKSFYQRIMEAVAKYKIVEILAIAAAIAAYVYFFKNGGTP